jgi:DNA-binding MarR family transcriptional regulator
MATPQPFDLEDQSHRDLALRVGHAWREIRRGASMSSLADYFFGVGDDALESGQMDTLDVLVQQDGWRMGDLAEALRVDPSTATRAVQRLERIGLAHRTPSRDDKRVVIVSATDAGRTRHSEALARRQDAMRFIMNSFDANEREQLAVCFEKFVHALDEFVTEIDESRVERIG